MRFPGQYYDEETGLHYNWHRYYNPATGRYITSDPIGLAGGLNTFGYVHQRPLNSLDPDGRLAIVGVLPFLTGGAAASGGVSSTFLGAGGLVAGGLVVASIPGDTPVSQEFARETEYLRYHHLCDNPPPPSGDHCQDKLNKINWLKQCRNMRQEWDDRYFPGRHESNLKSLDRAIKKAERIYKNSWGCHDRPPVNECK